MPTCEQVLAAVLRTPRVSPVGRVVQVVGHTVESSGPRSAVGDLCRIERQGAGGPVLAEVVGLREGRIVLMAFEGREERGSSGGIGQHGGP